jgi:hypothetical protein
MFDFIKNLRYDIFLIYSSLFLIGGISYVYYKFNPQVFVNYTQNPEFVLLYILVAWLSVYIFFIGLSEFQNNYFKEKEMLNLRMKLEKYEIENKLKIYENTQQKK